MIRRTVEVSIVREAYAELWTYEADLRVVTTNPIVRRDGACVMGAGCAKQLAVACPEVPYRLGALLQEYGNRPFRIARVNGSDVATYPVKHHWKEEADLALIKKSACLLEELVTKFGYSSVVMPRPGCGNGKLSWVRVRPHLEELLDDRFTVVTWG